jgi:serine/threonine-protein kinase HipA
MSLPNTILVYVYLNLGSKQQRVGRLALKDRRIFFEYDSSFHKTKLELSPFKLPLQPNLVVCEDPIFEGLFGVFNDSLPDGWGRFLLDRKLRTLNINPGNLSALDRLCYVGKHGMGALIYEPAITDNTHSHPIDLDQIADEALYVLENDDDRFVDDLLHLSGASAGARPKIITAINNEEWIIKFRSLLDPKDIGPIEYAYYLMAKEAKLNVSEAKLFPSKKGAGYFGAKRFDRAQGQHLHMHTMSGLLHADHRLPSLDYEMHLKATLLLTKDARECEKQFRVAVFNILSHNRDDHAKNFSFLMDEKGTWRVSPAYDLTFSFGPNGEHCSTVMGEGKNPTFSHLLKLAEVVGIKKQKALQIIDEVSLVISNWKTFAQEAGVSASSSKAIETAITQIRKKFSHP